MRSSLYRGGKVCGLGTNRILSRTPFSLLRYRMVLSHIFSSTSDFAAIYLPPACFGIGCYFTLPSSRRKKIERQILDNHFVRRAYLKSAFIFFKGLTLNRWPRLIMIKSFWMLQLCLRFVLCLKRGPWVWYWGKHLVRSLISSLITVAPYSISDWLQTLGVLLAQMFVCYCILTGGLWYIPIRPLNLVSIGLSAFKFT